MANEDYDWSTARAVCNDAQKHTWHVEAKRVGGRDYWVVSDSSEMSEDEADAWLNNLVAAD